MKILSPRMHSVLDYLLAGFLAATPFLFVGRSDTLPVGLCAAVSTGLLLMSMVTHYPGGVIGLLPFPLHGAIELLGGLALIGLPWIAGFGDEAYPRDFFIILGVSVVVLFFATDYRYRPEPGQDP